MMKKEKILEIWHTFDAANTANVFYSIICDDSVVLPLPLKDVYLFGKIYKGDSNEPYIEIATNILSELIVPKSLSRTHQEKDVNGGTYRVGVFLVNDRLFIVEGCDTDGKSVVDSFEGYQRLFTASYDEESNKWTIPVSDICNTFNHISPISTGVDRDFGKHIMKLCKSFDW